MSIPTWISFSGPLFPFPENPFSAQHKGGLFDLSPCRSLILHLFCVFPSSTEKNQSERKLSLCKEGQL